MRPRSVLIRLFAGTLTGWVLALQVATAGDALIKPPEALAMEPGWTTSIDAGGDTSLPRLGKRQASALGYGPGQPMPDFRHNSGGPVIVDSFGCRHRIHKATSTRFELRSRCYISSFPRF